MCLTGFDRSADDELGVPEAFGIVQQRHDQPRYGRTFVSP
jgi:hypothetical protein